MNHPLEIIPSIFRKECIEVESVAKFPRNDKRRRKATKLGMRLKVRIRLSFRSRNFFH